MRQLVLIFALSLLLVPLAGCGDQGAGDGGDQGAGDAGLEPVRAQEPTAAPRASAAPGSAAMVSFDLPEGWEERSPSSQMRAAEATIPGEGGAGDLVVFYFGPGQGGGVEDNIQRWIQQMEVEPGTEPERGSFEEGPLTIHHVTVHGTLLPSTMGSGPSTPQEDSMMMAAVVEGPSGPWFFKATGPETTLEGERDAFLEMLRSIEPPA